MKRALVCGAGGFLGTHLVKRLKAAGYFVRGVDRKVPRFENTGADEFLLLDLRNSSSNDFIFEKIDEVYQLACEVGGLGYIMNRDNDAEMLRNSATINLRVLEACRFMKVPKIFFASSACVYSSLDISLPMLSPGMQRIGIVYQNNYMADGRVLEEEIPIACRESDVPPANPDNEYAWEKIFAERLYAAYARNFGMQVRIARFHNFYGPLGAYDGGREKAPAAICRKIALASDPGECEIWGTGTQRRSFMYVDDAVEGVIRLMRSDFQGPVNIGSSEMVTVNQLVEIVAGISGKRITSKPVDGIMGVLGRNSDNSLIREQLDWEPSISLRDGLAKTYPWIVGQIAVDKVRSGR